MSMSCLLMFSLLLGQGSLAEAGASLRGVEPVVDAKSVESSLLEELASNFRAGAGKEHIFKIEELLRPMYLSMPQEEGGIVGHSVARYMLHRFFAEQHGWFIRGLEPGTGATALAPGVNGSSGNQTLQDLQEWVPAFLQSFIEQLQNGKGISLREVAIIAATLDDLVHKESIQHLDQAFEAVELDRNTALDQAQLREVLEVWMMIYFLGGKFHIKGKAKVLKAHAIFIKNMRSWDAVQEWIHGIQAEIYPIGVEDKLNFTGITRVVEEAGRRYATFNQGECSSLKSTLLEIESTKAGRVRLNDFYKKGLGGVFNFAEKPDYLQTLGALDDADPKEPSVILANYVSARPNCLVTSSFYAICCRNECEGMMTQLEEKIQAPTVTPETVVELVSTMSTETVKGPRDLPELLVQRLRSIADANGGAVPLHGRLFAQWMHHSFPRECPYPHQAGTTSAQTPDEWVAATGQKDAQSKEELQVLVDGDTCSLKNCATGAEAREHQGNLENQLPWDDNEELLQPSWMQPLEERKEFQVLPEEVLAPKQSLFRNFSASMAALASIGALVWKLMAQRKAGVTVAGTTFRSGLMV